MKRTQVSAFGIVLAALLAFLATTGFFLIPNKLDGVWLSIYAASFASLFFAVDVPEAEKQDEKN